jgi:hypothetical protein
VRKKKLETIILGPPRGERQLTGDGDPRAAELLMPLALARFTAARRY